MLADLFFTGVAPDKQQEQAALVGQTPTRNSGSMGLQPMVEHPLGLAR